MARLLTVDPEIVAARVSPFDLEALRAGSSSAIESIATACAQFAMRPCVGVRVADSRQHEFSATTYGELWSWVVGLASGLNEEGLVEKGSFVGIYGPVSLEWILMDLACLYLGAVSVPLQKGLSLDDLVHIARETRLACVAAAPDCLATTTQIAEECRSVRTVIGMNGHDSRTSGVVWLDDIRGAAAARGARPPVANGDGLFSIVYTSGSTGRPKGVMLTEQRWAQTLRGALRRNPVPTITVGYLPLSHMAGRIVVYTTMMMGGRINLVAEDDMSELFEAIRATRPTSLTLVPRVSGAVYQQFLERSLEADVDVTQGYGAPAVAAILDEIRDRELGGRLCFASTGAAPTAPAVAEFLARGLGIHVVDAYGSTEVARVAVNGVIEPGIEYKLIDLPELGYTSRDLPYPRGELAVKSPHQTPGYFRNPAANATLFDEDGFVRTGDIVEERGPRQIAWIDRKSDVIRLAGGEFVNLSRLESLYAHQSPYIEQVFLFGDSSRDYLLAVVVPKRTATAAVASLAPGSGLDREAALKRLLRSELDRVASANRLSSRQVPRDFLVNDEPFTRSNGLVSDAGKYRRPVFRERYGRALQQLYDEIDHRQVRAGLEVARLSGAPLDLKLLGAVAAVLGRDRLSREELDNSFVRLGGDSLSAVRLRGALGRLGVQTDVAVLLDAETSLAALVERLRDADGRAATLPTFERIHGRTRRWARAKDLELSQFVPEPLLVGANRLPIAAQPRHYLLTGASGFLGHVVLAELLRGARGDDICVTCIVRARNGTAARDRVIGRLRALEHGLIGELHERRAPAKLQVLAGDLTKPHFGLPASTYAELSERADAVIHAAALVNHILSYEDLFAADVLATAQIMRFAVSRQCKPLHFVSTSAVAASAHRRGLVMESEPAAKLCSRRPIRASSELDYASGYTTSKWAAEVLLSDLHATCRVPIAVSRCSMILPHRERHDVINPTDAFARLLYGIVKTGVAPISFYADDYRGDRHYDGLPVDLVARAIAGTMPTADDAFETYHMCNPNTSDGISLDTIVDWIESAGYRVSRLGHSAWHAEFVRRLADLGPEERRRSPEAIAFRWREPIRERRAVSLDATNFRRALAGLGVQAIPSLDEHYVHGCLRGICGDVR